MIHRVLEGIQYLTLGNIDVGSILMDRKPKPLTQRWFIKCKEIDSKKLSSETKYTIYITRHKMITFECVYGTVESRVMAMENFQVLAIFIKHYNTWFFIKENKIEWYPKYVKGKYRVLARK